MAETKHTPGPWGIYRDSAGRLSEIGAPCHEHPNCGKTIVFITSGSLARPFQCSQGKSTEANARLIAAAPDLLAALKAVLDDSTTFKVYMQMAEAAIAKAEGK